MSIPGIITDQWECEEPGQTAKQPKSAVKDSWDWPLGVRENDSQNVQLLATRKYRREIQNST